MNYQTRLNNALKNHHQEVFDKEKNDIKEEYRKEIDCPVCNSGQYKIYCIKDGFVHRRCSNCTMVYLSPRFTNEATTAFYNSRVNEIYNEAKFHSVTGTTSQADKTNLQNLQIILSHLEKDTAKLKLLEVGSGYGFFLKNAQEKGFDVYGLELNEKLFELTKYISPNMYNRDIFEVKFDDSLFDVIYMRDVIEHISNPLPFINELYRIAKQGCVLMFDTHNIDSMVNSFTKEYHTVIFAFEHPVHWSSKTLALAGEKAGFQHIKTYYNHDGQSISWTLAYLLNPSFTYIFKPDNNSLRYKIMNVCSGYIKIPGMARFDRWFMRTLSKLMKKGATMKVILIKQ